MQNPNNVGNGAGTSRDGRWIQMRSTNMLQTTTPPVWNELPPDSIPSVPVSTNNVFSDYHGTSSVNNINVLSNQLVYNPPNYMNIPYPGNAVPNGYTIINPTRGINPQIIYGQNLLPTQNGQIIGGPGCSNKSALQRFISQRPARASSKTTGGTKKQKRIRTIFTTQQVMQLEQEYAKGRYVDRGRRLELADVLRLNERIIKIWFQNRRMREKKDRAESVEDCEDASTSVSYKEMSNIHVPIPMHDQCNSAHRSPLLDIGFSQAAPQLPVLRHAHPVCHYQGNNYVEQYPPVSIPDSMPGTSLPTLVPVLNSVQGTYPTFMLEEECQAQYQQAQPYQPPYTEVQQLSSELEPRTDSPTPTAPSAIIEESSDLPWLRFSLDL